MMLSGFDGSPGPLGLIDATSKAAGDRAAVLFNRGEKPADMKVTWDQLDLAPKLKAEVRDLWSGRTTRGVAGEFGGRVAPHGVLMVRVTPSP